MVPRAGLRAGGDQGQAEQRGCKRCDHAAKVAAAAPFAESRLCD
jgi:hypothetical protein